MTIQVGDLYRGSPNGMWRDIRYLIVLNANTTSAYVVFNGLTPGKSPEYIEYWPSLQKRLQQKKHFQRIT